MHPVHDQVLDYIGDPTCGSFDELALSVFAHQFDTIDPYRRYCTSRRRTPLSVQDWRQIPPVPIQAFKEVELRCGPAQRVFLSTGTTAGPNRRSRHALPDPRLYRTAAVAGMRAFLFPDVERMSLVSLIPRASAAPDSSLAQMVEWAIEDLAADQTASFADGSTIAIDAFADFLRGAERSGRPCCLMTTTGVLIGVLDDFRRRDLRFRLPHGSRIMDTGGFKGAPRHVSRNGLLRECWNALAVPGYFCVNEYGMAELSSQLYDNVIANRCRGQLCARFKIGPHWTRTLIVDPDSLQPLRHGKRGLLCHFDLANAGTALAVLTEDVGVAVENGFEIIGRAAGAEPRGCSLSLMEWR